MRAGPATQEVHDIERHVFVVGLMCAKVREGADDLVARGSAADSVFDNRTKPQHELVM